MFNLGCVWRSGKQRDVPRRFVSCIPVHQVPLTHRVWDSAIFAQEASHLGLPMTICLNVFGYGDATGGNVNLVHHSNNATFRSNKMSSLAGEIPAINPTRSAYSKS